MNAAKTEDNFLCARTKAGNKTIEVQQMNMQTAGESQAMRYKNARNLRGILLCKKQLEYAYKNTVGKPRENKCE